MIQVAVLGAEEMHHSDDIAAAVRLTQTTHLNLETILVDAMEEIAAEVTLHATTETPTIVVDADEGIVYSFSSNPPMTYDVPSVKCAYEQYRKGYEQGENTAPESVREEQEARVEKDAIIVIQMKAVADAHHRNPLGESQRWEERDAFLMWKVLHPGEEKLVYDMAAKMV